MKEEEREEREREEGERRRQEEEERQKELDDEANKWLVSRCGAGIPITRNERKTWPVDRAET